MIKLNEHQIERLAASVVSHMLADEGYMRQAAEDLVGTWGLDDYYDWFQESPEAPEANDESADKPVNQDGTRVTTIVAEIASDGYPPSIYRVHHDDHADPVVAIRAAAREFVTTPEGQEYLGFAVGGDCFNWGDAVTAIPPETLDRYGIRALVVLDLGSDVVTVDHDECILRN